MDKPVQSVLMATAVGAMVLGIFNGVAPSITDVSAHTPDDDLHSNTRVAGFVAGGLVGGISLIMKDPTIFVVGSALTIGYVWWLHAANHTISAPSILSQISPVQGAVKKAVKPAVEPAKSGTDSSPLSGNEYAGF